MKHYIRVTAGPYTGTIYEFPTKKEALALARALESARPYSTDYGNERDGFPEVHLKDGRRAAPPPRALHGHARMIESPVTGRDVFAAHERDGHITTRGRRSLSASEFALPPGPEEKRRGIKGRLPIDEIGRARSALARASMMYNDGTITEHQLQQVRRAVHKKWPSIDIESHARMIESPATGREIFAAKERDHHITTHGRQMLAADQFALPPGPEEKRRGIKGRLPIDTLARARNALARAAQMKKAGHLSAGQLATVQRKVHAAWPSIAS